VSSSGQPSSPPTEAIVTTSTLASTHQQQLDPRRLLKVVESVVRNRSGSVLARQTILKADHFRQGMKCLMAFSIYFLSCHFFCYSHKHQAGILLIWSTKL
jgi:hypothetical protein